MEGRDLCGRHPDLSKYSLQFNGHIARRIMDHELNPATAAASRNPRSHVPVAGQEASGAAGARICTSGTVLASGQRTHTQLPSPLFLAQVQVTQMSEKLKEWERAVF